MAAASDLPGTQLVTAEAVRQQILGILGRWGMPDDLAATTARAMVETDLMGIDSHGISSRTGASRDRLAGLAQTLCSRIIFSPIRPTPCLTAARSPFVNDAFA